jgi:hypothetical protein
MHRQNKEREGREMNNEEVKINYAKNIGLKYRPWIQRVKNKPAQTGHISILEAAILDIETLLNRLEELEAENKKLNDLISLSAKHEELWQARCEEHVITIDRLREEIDNKEADESAPLCSLNVK